MKISYSAPAKVILSGEHAVVYGKPALVSTIDLRLTFSLVIPAKAGIQKKNWIPDQVGDDIMFIAKKAREYLNTQKIKFINKPFNYKIESDIPIGRGLGSSAALSVASSAAFLEFYTGQQFKKERVNDLAFEIEKHFHLNPSGVDNSVACFGGLILYQKQIGLKNVKNKIPKNIEEKLFLIDSGKPKETTWEMVKSVESVKSVKTIFNKIEIETRNMKHAIETENVDKFKIAIVNNENLLEDLGVISYKTKNLLKNLSKFGVGKVTGAGGYETGSGFILFFTENEKELVSFFKKNMISYYKFVPDNLGLKRISL